MYKMIFIGLCAFLICIFVFRKGAIAVSLIDAKNIVNIEIQEVSEQKKIKIRIKAHLFESSYSVDKIETQVSGDVLIIKAYKKYVMFVPKEKRRSEIELELTIPDSVNEVRFYGGTEAVWSRSKLKKNIGERNSFKK